MTDTPPKVIQAGLSRSGSTVAWQICKSLINNGDVCKTHSFNTKYSGVPVILTVRDPCDAALSFHDASNTDGGKPSINAFGPHFSSASHMVRWYNEHKGPVFIVRYEKWYPDVEKLILHIAQCLKVHVDQEQLAELVIKHSYESNQKIADEQKVWKNYDKETHIHGKHLNGGTPGRSNGVFDDAVLSEARHKLQPFLQTFGYSI